METLKAFENINNSANKTSLKHLKRKTKKLVTQIKIYNYILKLNSVAQTLIIILPIFHRFI